MSLKRLLYTVFIYLIFPIVLLRLVLKGKSNSDYLKRWSERFGFVKLIENSSVICLHAVSVGEAIAAKPLIEKLLSAYPNTPILVTTTTPTGSDRVTEMFSEQIKNNQLIHTYLPYDLLGSVSRFISRFNPKILIVVETEIWPNLFAKCHQKNVPIVIVNARLSEKSTQSYLKFKDLISETLSKVNIIAVRSEIDAKRFAMLGAELEQIQEAGNIKYDISIDRQQVERAKKYLALFNAKSDVEKSMVYVAASTHKTEDEKLLRSYLKLLEKSPNLLLILVPRHPERFDSVYESACEILPETMTIFRHSQGVDAFDVNKHNVILGDTMGEMQMWFATADVVFIGGSLVDVGGHNPLEATLFGVPVVSGPHMFNFDDVVTDLLAEDLLFICNDEDKIGEKASQLLIERGQSKKEINALDGVKENEFMQRHQGVTERLMDIVSGFLK